MIVFHSESDDTLIAIEADMVTALQGSKSAMGTTVYLSGGGSLIVPARMDTVVDALKKAKANSGSQIDVHGFSVPARIDVELRVGGRAGSSTSR